MVNILAFPELRTATRTEIRTPASPDAGGRPLLSATPDGLVVISASPRAEGATFLKGDWTNQELADLYRVEALLVQANIHISTGRGLTDEGDPWFVFCKEDGDVFVHLARTGGSYLLDSPGLGEILHGPAFATLIERFIQIAAAKATPTSNIVALRPRTSRDSVVRLHPAVMLAALVWSLYLASSKFGGVAHAADDLAGHDGSTHHQDDLAAHGTPSPSDIDGALAHLVEHMPKSEDDAAVPTVLAPERAVSTVFLDAGDKNGVELRTATATATTGFSAQGVAASLTMVAFSYGLYISADEQRPPQETAGKSAPLPAPVVEDHHATPAPAAMAVMMALEQSTSQHDIKPVATVDVDASNDAAPKAVFPIFTSDVHDVKLAMDIPAMAHAAAASAQAMVSEFLSRREESNVVIDKLVAAPAKTVAEQAVAADAVTSDTQSVLGLINHYLGSGDVYKVGGLTVSATLDINDLDKVLSHLADLSGAQSAVVTAPAINASMDGAAIGSSLDKVQQANPTPAIPAAIPSVVAVPSTAATAASTAAAHAASPYAHYDDQAKQFVTHFIQESNSIQMVQFNSTIVLVDMSVIVDPGDQIYSRSWSTDDGHVISTIGHLQDFVTQGMV